MKKVILIAIAFMSLNATAQKRDHQQNRDRDHKKAEQFNNMSAEEIATLQTKKMTLNLDLTESQQQKIYNINLEKTKERKAKRDERDKVKKDNTEGEHIEKNRFENLNARLDDKIAHKNEMKSILNADQYEKWERSQKRKGMKRHHKKRRTKRQK